MCCWGRRSLWTVWLFATLALMEPMIARAQPAVSPEAAPPNAAAHETTPPPALAVPALRIEPSVWSALAALGPGLLLHGSGAFVAGDRVAARRLALSELGGLATFVAAAGLLAQTGASRRLIGPLTSLTVLSGGVFF